MAARKGEVVSLGDNGRLELNASYPPRCPRDGVLVAVSAVGICGTDLQIINGSRPDKSKILGHEGLGTIVAKGRDCSAFAVGSQVIFNPVSKLDQDLILGHNVKGVLQTTRSFMGSELRHGYIVPVSKQITKIQGVLAEPLAATIYSVRLCSPYLRGGTVLIFGGGGVGCLASIYLRSRGVKSCIVTRRKVNEAHITPDFRATLCNVETKAKKDEIGEIDAALLCTPRTGSLEALEIALRTVRSGGCVDLISGIIADPTLRRETEKLIAIRRANVRGMPSSGRYLKVSGKNGAIWITGHRGTSESDLMLALEELGRSVDLYSPIVTHEADVAAAPALIEQLADGDRMIDGSICLRLLVRMQCSQDA